MPEKASELSILKFILPGLFGTKMGNEFHSYRSSDDQCSSKRVRF